MNKLEEAKMLATDLEFAQDALSEGEEALASLCSPWNDTISALHEQIRNLAKMREAIPAVIAERARLAQLEQRLADLKSELYEVAVSLIDDNAFFPSGMKSQVLTDRVTLKSQLPTAPEIVDLLRFLDVALEEGALHLITKKVEVKLDGPLAARWWAQQPEGFDTGLGPPKPKILSIKVKERKDDTGSS